MTRRNFIGAASAFGACVCGRVFAEPSGQASSGRPNLLLGVLSDIHIRNVETGYGSDKTFIHALEYFRDRNVDAVLIAGDLADLGLGDELMRVGRDWLRVFPNNKAPDGHVVEKLFITGNHESCVFAGNGNANTILKLYGNDEAEVFRQILRNDFSGWWEKAFGEPYARFYHKNVKGYDFLCAHWDDGTKLIPGKPITSYDWSIGRETFGVELGEWLAKHGSELDPRKPFFYQQHRSLWKTNFDDWAWNHDCGKATAVLSKWPNAVSFSGDTHYPLTDERSVWQGAFTALGTASLDYPGQFYDSRDGASYENSGTRGGFMKLNAEKAMPVYYSGDTKQGMVLSVYEDRMVFERRDFLVDRPLGADWVIPLGEKPYTYKVRKEKVKAPEFPSDATLEVRDVKVQTRGGHGIKPQKKPGVEIVIPPAPVTDSNRCVEYEVAAVGEDGLRTLFYVIAEGYDHALGTKRTLMTTNFRVSLDRLPKSISRFEVTPLDCWWNRGRALQATMPKCV